MTHTHKTYKAAILQTTSHKVLRNNVIETLADFDLSPNEWTILGHIFHNESLRFVDIAQFLQVEPPHITTLIDILQKKKLVQRKDDPTDRRAKRIYLTKKAEDLVPGIEVELSSRMNLLLEGVSADEMSTYFRVLESIIKNGTKLEEAKQKSSIKSESLTRATSKT